MPAFPIAGRPVGDGHPVFIIAELSANHGGRLDIALQSIERAAKLGVDAIKLQTYTPDTLTLRCDTGPFVVRTKNEWAGRTLWDLYREAMTPWEWHAELKACAEAAGVALFSTPFDATATAFLETLDVPAYKIASFEIVDLPLVETVARRGRPMIISTGMASLGEIEAAVQTCRAVGNDAIAVLRCVSSYPARPDAMNLESIATLRSLGVVVGLSDHTRENHVAVASVALGARIVEKHFMLDRSIGGPDAFFSLEPDELDGLVKAIRQTERAMGPPRFGPSEDEKASTQFRRSLFVSSDVRKGETLSVDSVRSVRPASGLSPKHLPFVLGRTATSDITTGTPLTWEHVGGVADATAIDLREAAPIDAEVLLAWRNDPETRRQSRTTGVVSVSEHTRWLEQTLKAEDRKLFVAQLGEVPAGTARLDRIRQGLWEVSIAVAPEQRGKRLSTSMLRALEVPARALGAFLLAAEIRAENAASVASFKRAGYYGFVEVSRADGKWLCCERRIVPWT